MTSPRPSVSVPTHQSLHSFFMALVQISSYDHIIRWHISGEEEKGCCFFLINSRRSALFYPQWCKNSLQIDDHSHIPSLWFFSFFPNRSIFMSIIRVLMSWKTCVTGLSSSQGFAAIMPWLLPNHHVIASSFHRCAAVCFLFVFWLESTSQRDIILFILLWFITPFIKLAPTGTINHFMHSGEHWPCMWLEHFKPRCRTGNWRLQREWEGGVEKKREWERERERPTFLKKLNWSEISAQVLCNKPYVALLNAISNGNSTEMIIYIN